MAKRYDFWGKGIGVFFVSLCTPGLCVGQFMNGEWQKAIMMWGCYILGLFAVFGMGIGVLLIFGTYIWSVIDATVVASRID